VYFAKRTQFFSAIFNCPEELGSDKIRLELVEVQTGSYLGEDDMIRIEDDYQRS
jgi:hypothetical protein